MAAQKITIEGFLDEFKQRHEQLEDRPFCWILGSGASIQSGIPSGKTLTLKWLKELHQREDFDKLPIEQWATAENLSIKDFDYGHAANFYPWIYERRFRDFKEQGYAFLEKTMERAEPSFGYSVLAQIMATTQHKVAITTNFDNLIADALSIYTRTFPLVCGHESLTGYIRANLRRPLVAKVHRDLLLAPLSDPKDIAALPGDWATALKKIFDRFTPIVLGYAGNDGSLMGFLKNLSPIEGSIFWCYLEGDETDSDIHEVIKRHHGRLVPIAGFDEVMLQLQEKLQLPFLLPVLQGVHDKRVLDYQKQFEVLTKKLSETASDPALEEVRRPARKAAEAAVERLTKEKDWWAWQLKANAETDPLRRESIYREGIEDFPKSAELLGNFANFMGDVRKDFDQAERLYQETLKLDPNNAMHTGNFAVFMRKVRKNYDEAERLYRKTLTLDPNHALHTGNFAVFMEIVRQDYDEAERLFRKTLELDPKHVLHTCNFAAFMSGVRQDHEEAERLYQTAFEIDPHMAHIGAFASFMAYVRKDYDEAELLYRKALELDPKNADRTVYYALFMEDVRKDNDEAERLFRKALEIDPNSALSNSTFATFLYHKRKVLDEADRLYRKALELDPNNSSMWCNFGQFLAATNHFDEARDVALRAWQLLEGPVKDIHAEIAITRWLLDRAADLDGTPALGRLKTIIALGFSRGIWSFDELLGGLIPQLPENEHTLARKLADAVLDESKVAALEEEPIWKAVEPMPLDVPWTE